MNRTKLPMASSATNTYYASLPPSCRLNTTWPFLLERVEIRAVANTNIQQHLYSFPYLDRLGLKELHCTVVKKIAEGYAKQLSTAHWPL